MRNNTELISGRGVTRGDGYAQEVDARRGDANPDSTVRYA